MYMLSTCVDYCGTSQLRSSMGDQRSFESGPNPDVGSYRVIWWILCIQCMCVIVIAHPGGMQYYY